jgi:hypothetical protein
MIANSVPAECLLLVLFFDFHRLHGLRERQCQRIGLYHLEKHSTVDGQLLTFVQFFLVIWGVLDWTQAYDSKRHHMRMGDVRCEQPFGREQSPTLRDSRTPAAVGHPAVVANPHQTLGQNVQQKTPDEFLGRQRHLPLLAATGVVLVAKRDPAVLQSNEPMIGNGHAMDGFPVSAPRYSSCSPAGPGGSRHLPRPKGWTFWVQPSGQPDSVWVTRRSL